MERPYLGLTPAREICKACWRPNAVGFVVPDDVWQQVVPEALAERVLCVACFASFADERLIDWARDIEFWPVSVRTWLDLEGGTGAP